MVAIAIVLLIVFSLRTKKRKTLGELIRLDILFYSSFFFIFSFIFIIFICANGMELTAEEKLQAIVFLAFIMIVCAALFFKNKISGIRQWFVNKKIRIVILALLIFLAGLIVTIQMNSLSIILTVLVISCLYSLIELFVEKNFISRY